MDSFIKLDIFFFITTISVLALSVAVIVVLIYLIKILRDLKYISQKVKVESDEIIKDIEIIRTETKAKGLRFLDVISFMFSFFKKKDKKSNKSAH